MLEHPPTVQTLLLIGVFAAAYLVFLMRKTLGHQLDLYDLIMLSMVAIVPAFFVFLPFVAVWISRLAGVAFPFVIMFGLLLFILFILVHRLTLHMHKVENQNRLLIQELSLMKLEVERLQQDD